MKRYEIAARIGSGTDADPYRANVAGSHSVVGQVGSRMLVKRLLPDGTPATAATVADLDDSNPDSPAQDVAAVALTAGQVSAAKAFLANNGIDVGTWDADAVDDRRKLLRFLLRRWLGWRVQDFSVAIGGFDVGG